MDILVLKSPRSISVLAATSLFIPLLQTPAIAEEGVAGVQGVSISGTESSLTLSWEPVPGAVEYVAFEELPKPEYDRDALEPIYRGGDPNFTLDGLGAREVSRIRIIAVDEDDLVLARTLIRTSTHGAVNPAQEVNWIASGEGVEIFLGQQGNEIPFLEAGASGTSSSLEFNETFFDEGFSGGSEIYELSTEELIKPTSLQNPDSPLPELVAQNHVVEVPEFLAPPEGTLEAEMESLEKVMVTQTMARKFEWEAFIEDDYIPAPVFCDTAWEELGDMRFGGDDRDFSRWKTGQTNRFVISVRADFNWPEFVGSPPSFRGWRNPGTLPVRSVGSTNLYVEQADGSMEFRESATAPRDELTIDRTFVNRTTADFHMTADSTNPLCAVLGFFEAPAINVAMNVILHADGTYSYAGARDAAPNHQAVVDTYRIQTYPSPSYAEYMESYNNFHTTCVHKHTNVGFASLALPPVPVTFNNSNHGDPSANGDCSTVDP